MTPDLDARVGRLETAQSELRTDVATMRQQLNDVVADVNQLMPLALTVNRMEVMVTNVQQDVSEIVNRMDKDAVERRQGQKERAKENRGYRITLIVAVIAACAALLSAVIGAVAVLFA